MEEQVAYPRAMAQVTRLSDRVWVAGVLLVVGGLVVWAFLPVTISCGIRSPKAQCLSNLKQIGMAAAIYAADNDGQVPSASSYTFHRLELQKHKSTYQELFAPYLNSRENGFRCPTDLERKESPVEGQSWYETYGSSYRFFQVAAQLKNFGYTKDASKMEFARDAEAFHETPNGATSNALYYDGHAIVLKLTKAHTDL